MEISHRSVCLLCFNKVTCSVLSPSVLLFLSRFSPQMVTLYKGFYLSLYEARCLLYCMENYSHTALPNRGKAKAVPLISSSPLSGFLQSLTVQLSVASLPVFLHCFLRHSSSGLVNSLPSALPVIPFNNTI